MPRPAPRAHAFLHAVIIAQLTIPVASAVATAQSAPRTGEAVVQAMHDRYAATWYRTMTFVQRTTFAERPDQTWYETVEVPGRLRIDVAPVDSMNAFMFIGDSTIVFRRGQRANARGEGNVLAVLIMDAFVSPVPETVARLRKYGFDLSRVSSGTFRGRAAWIVGAAGGDTTVSQFWIDAERLHLVRVLEVTPGQPLTDIHVLGHRLMNGVWVEHELHVYRGGTEVQGEYYAEVKLDTPVDPAVWNTTRWVRPAWIPAADRGPMLTPETRLSLVNGRALWEEYRGRHALRLAPLAGQEQATDQEIQAVLVGPEFRDGVIEVDVAGARRQGYATDDVSAFKGFIGVSFRVRGDTAERLYLRPENARLENQLFRNRSTQYEASPDFTWQRLRQEQPGQYESYVDLEAGAWTHLRIEVAGTKARLYVNGAAQPALVVNDLKHGEGRGAIALWTRISSDAYFSNLTVTPR